MRLLATVFAVLLGLLLTEGRAEAQFQNKSIGLAVGVVYPQSTMGIGPTFPLPSLTLDATLYIEKGFDVGLRFGGAIQKNAINQQIVVLYPAASLRYLLIEDYVRPWVGANIEYVHIFDDAGVAAGILKTSNYVGIAPAVGVEWFFTEAWSLGADAELAVYWMLNAGVKVAPQFHIRVATHF